MTSVRQFTAPNRATPRKVALSGIPARFARNRRAVFGLVMLASIITILIGGAFAFTPDDAEDTSLRNRYAPPSSEHLFGTDSIGRDVLARTIYGGQVSLTVAVVSALLTLTIGASFGLLAGYYSGWVDSLIMRFTEALLSIPLLFLLLALSRASRTTLADVELLGRDLSDSILVLIVIIGFTGWMPLARLVRANALSLKAQGFVLAARASGASSWWILRRHILPNTLSTIIVFGSLAAAQAILLESYVSFLGLGVQAPAPSWGNMIQRSVELIDRAPWLWIFPGGFITLTVISINFIGDGLRDSL